MKKQTETSLKISIENIFHYLFTPACDSFFNGKMVIQNKSGYRGVYAHPSRKGQWMVVLYHQKRRYTEGPFTSKKVAAMKYDELKLRYSPNAKRLNYLSHVTSSHSPANAFPILNMEKRDSGGCGSVKNVATKATNSNRNGGVVAKSLLGYYQSVIRHDRIAFSPAFRNQFCIHRNRRCDMCSKFIVGYFEIDHILPLSLYGSNDVSNLQLLCFDCHKFKSNHIDRMVEDYIKSLPSIQPGDLFNIQKQIIEIQRLEKNRSSPAKNKNSVQFFNIQGNNYLCIPVQKDIHSDFQMQSKIAMVSYSGSGSTDKDSCASDHDIEIIIEDCEEDD